MGLLVQPATSVLVFALADTRHNELIALLDRADIYVHCASVEIEGLAALEAMTRDCMPILARSAQFVWI